MMCTLDVAWKSAQVLGGARGYEAAGSSAVRRKTLQRFIGLSLSARQV